MEKPFTCPVCGGRLQRALEVYRKIDQTSGLPSLRLHNPGTDTVRALECAECFRVVTAEELATMIAGAAAHLDLAGEVPCFNCDNHPERVDDCHHCEGTGVTTVGALLAESLSPNTFPDVARGMIGHLQRLGYPYPIPTPKS